MTERAYWIGHVRPALAPFGKVLRVENAVDLGTPDVSYCLRRRKEDPGAAGWIELKYLPQLPARASSPVVLEKLTIDQVRFMDEWTQAGGRAFLLLRADDHHILMKSGLAWGIYHKLVTAPEIMAKAEVWAIGRFPVGRILSCLCS